MNLCHCVVNRVRDRQAGPTLRRNRVPLAHQCDDHGIEPVVNARSRHWSARRGLAVGIRAPPAPTGLRILVIGRIKNEAAAAGVQKAWAEPSSPWREAECLRRRADLQIPSGRALQPIRPASRCSPTPSRQRTLGNPVALYGRGRRSPGSFKARATNRSTPPAEAARRRRYHAVPHSARRSRICGQGSAPSPGRRSGLSNGDALRLTINVLLTPLGRSSQKSPIYRSSQTSSIRQPLTMLLTIVVKPFTWGCQQVAPRV